MKLSKYNLISHIKGNTVIYNTLSGGVLSLNQEYTKKYDKIISYFDGVESDISECDDLIIELKKGQMILDESEDEFEKLKFFFNKNKFNSDSLVLTIAPTLDCNFGCEYCYEKGVSYEYMNDEIEDGLIKFIQSRLTDKKALNIAWYGGEPLMAINNIESLTSKIRKMLRDDINYSASMVTNGYLLNEEMIQKLVALNVANIQITIDGAKEYHDKRRFHRTEGATFDTIISNLKLIRGRINTIIRVNVDNHNIDSLDEFIGQLDEFGVLREIPFYLAPVDDFLEGCHNSKCLSAKEFSAKEVEIYEKLRVRHKSNLKLPAGITSCGAVSVNSFVIGPNGDLYKCWNDVGRKELSICNLHESLKLNNNLLKWLNYEPLKADSCRKCNIAPSCMGGCPHKVLNGYLECNPNKFELATKLVIFASELI